MKIRTLTVQEKNIILLKFKRKGLKSSGKKLKKILNDTNIEFIPLLPRITLCIFTLKGVLVGNHYKNRIYYGVAMRSKFDPENSSIGERISFIRSVDELLNERLS